MRYVIITCVVIVAYWIFGWGYFQLGNQLFKTNISKREMFICNVINFIVLFIISNIKLHLIWNWTIFFIALYVEARVLYPGPRKKQMFYSLQAILIGLSTNLLCRSFCALLLNVPLSAFNNQINHVTNIKEYPIVIGFISAGLILYQISQGKYIKSIEDILSNSKITNFVIELIVILYGYLLLNLLLYNYTINDVVLKLWEMISVIFVGVSYSISLAYAYKNCLLERYREENFIMQRAVIEQENKNIALKTISQYDSLTGVYNRISIENKIKQIQEDQIDFYLCFIDLNYLKIVNDRYGHNYGDKYLMKVAEILKELFPQKPIGRYGGDEFIVLVHDLMKNEIVKKLEQANVELSCYDLEVGLINTLSISYGIVCGNDKSKYIELIHEADELMYQQKEIMHAQRKDS